MPHLDELREKMRERGVDGVLVTDPTDERYLSGFSFDDGMILVTLGSAYLLTDFRYAEAARAVCGEAGEFRIELPEKMIPCVEQILRGEGAKTLAIGEDALPVSEFNRIRDGLKGISVVGGGSAMLAELQRRKTGAELETIARAQAVTDAAFAHILNFIKPGMTEIEVALELEFFMRRNGAEGTAFRTIAVSGSASALPHGEPREVPLERGFLTMDFGAKVDGYCSDMTRTVVIGKADAEMKKLYATVLAAQKAALEAAEAGERSCRGLDGIARDLIEGAGYHKKFGHSLGHGVGVRIHEEPRLSPKAADGKNLLPGDVVTFEPGIYLEGVYGCRIEDMAAILPDGGFMNFTKSPKELIEL